MFIGFHTTFLVQHWLGIEGMQRRIADYLSTEEFTFLNQVSTVGAFLLGVSMIPFIWNVWTSHQERSRVTVDDPWGWVVRWVGHLVLAAAAQLLAPPRILASRRLRSAPSGAGRWRSAA